MKKIVIMAAGGFVGRSLTEYFGRSPEDYQVLPITRKNFSLLDETAVFDFIKRENPDVVINCANEGGARKSGYSENTDIVANNLRMFFNIERAISPETLLINFGSGAQYMKQRDLVEVKEETLADVMPQDAYGFSKLVMAKYIEGSSHRLTLNPTIFGLFGPFEDYTFKFISNAAVKNLLGMDIVINQNVRFDYLYIDDFCDIIEKLIAKYHGTGAEIPHRTFNITPTESITLKELADIVAANGEYKSQIFVKNPGLNFEYTGDNKNLLDNLGENYEFLTYNESVKRLYNYYKTHLDSLDTDTVKNDEYIKYCATRKSE